MNADDSRQKKQSASRATMESEQSDAEGGNEELEHDKDDDDDEDDDKVIDGDENPMDVDVSRQKMRLPETPLM